MNGDDICLDFSRPARIGFEEAILCAGKSRTQLATILTRVRAEGVSCLMTRLEAAAFNELSDEHKGLLDYDPTSRTGFFNRAEPRAAATSAPSGAVAVVAAGSSDLPVAAEAIRTLAYYRIEATPFMDVGVAGLWRLTRHLDDLRRFAVIIVVAGMDGALPSVLGGLVPGLLIAVPTSTGYGVAHGGETALHAALASCAQGLTVVNIDNGFGAACAALRALAMARLINGGE